MSDYPERINISPVYRQKRDDDFYLVDRKAFPGKGTEYIRSDLAKQMADEITRLRAQVAAVRSECIHTAKSWVYAFRESQINDSYSASYGASTVLNDLIEDTPDDAAQALDALLERAVKAALEEAAGKVNEEAERCRRIYEKHKDGRDRGKVSLWRVAEENEQLALDIEILDPAAIVQKVKAK